MQWLLLQLDPVKFCKIDIFEKISLNFRHMPMDSLISYLVSQFKRMKQWNEYVIPTVWDEAQLLLKKETDMFMSYTNDKLKRPLYTALVRAHQELLNRIRNESKSPVTFPVVALGTGLSLDQAKDAAASSVTKHGTSYAEVIVSNGYTTPQAVQGFLRKYYPDMPLHLAALFVGRARFPCNFIEKIVKHAAHLSSFETIADRLYDHSVEELYGLFMNLRSKFPDLVGRIDQIENFLEDGVFNFILVRP